MDSRQEKRRLQSAGKILEKKNNVAVKQREEVVGVRQEIAIKEWKGHAGKKS